MAKRTTIARERATYQSMHAGLPARVSKVPAIRTPTAVADLRRMTAIEGTQLMGPGRQQGSGTILYRHEFAPGTGPMIQRDLGRSRNNMVLSGGSYRINDEGMIEDMAKYRHHMRRYTNPESTLAFLVMTGLALGFVMIVSDIIQSLLPVNWNANVKAIGLDAVLIIGGAMLYKKSPVWAIALAGAGVAEAVQTAYVMLGLDNKIRAIMHRAPSAGLPSMGMSGLPSGRSNAGAQGYRRPAMAAV